MEGRVKTRIKRLRRSLGLTRVIIALSVGVMLPVLLSTSVGIVTLAVGEGGGSIVIGVLIISFAAAAFGSAVVATVLLGQRARVARAQADLLANVTHELRTPLAAIRMYSQTLEMGRVDDDLERRSSCVREILRETEWLEDAIERVLTWRGAAKDRLALDLRTGSLRDAVESAAEHFRRMIPPGEVSFAVEVTSDRPVRHDGRAVEEMVLNLLVNAYKYTGSDKQITLTVADVGEAVEIAVEDNGIGVSGSEVGKIFDPFYRVDSRLGGKASGAGLGLAIVRHAARGHEGEVYVESEQGEGSRFSVMLPVAEQQGAEAR